MAYSASLWGNLITEALRYGTRCQGSHSFTRTPTCLSANGMNHVIAFPAEAGPDFTDPEGWKAESAWYWLTSFMVVVTDLGSKCPELDPRAVPHVC